MVFTSPFSDYFSEIPQLRHSLNRTAKILDPRTFFNTHSVTYLIVDEYLNARQLVRQSGKALVVQNLRSHSWQASVSLGPSS